MAVRRRLGYLPQDLGLYPDLTPREFLDYVGLLKGLDDTRARRRQVDELLELVGADRTWPIAGSRASPAGCGGGSASHRRCSATQHWWWWTSRPPGLDPEERVRFRSLLAGLAGDRTVLLSTHIVEDVAQTCQQAAVMAAGRVVYTGTVADLVAAGEGATWEVLAPAGSRRRPGWWSRRSAAVTAPATGSSPGPAGPGRHRRHPHTGGRLRRADASDRPLAGLGLSAGGRRQNRPGKTGSRGTPAARQPAARTAQSTKASSAVRRSSASVCPRRLRHTPAVRSSMWTSPVERRGGVGDSNGRAYAGAAAGVATPCRTRCSRSASRRCRWAASAVPGEPVGLSVEPGADRPVRVDGGVLGGETRRQR